MNALLPKTHLKKKGENPPVAKKECENEYKQVSSVLYCFKYSQIAIYDSFQSM